ncbi:MAG: DUF4386 domain-containing protein [Melioribacteraceae bacterium]|nr:DUF4386 domain-containing protein [Melioribacteraceae bacterium]MCF8420689.1 DUF4386 domain-containing protein [Melioribacteraceae bacterium]
MKELNIIARLTGLGYLIIFITGFYANFFVLEGMLIDGDISQTTTNILNNSIKFNWGVYAFLLMVIVDILLAYPLYILIRSVDKNQSIFSSILRVVNGVIFGIALFNLFEIQKIAYRFNTNAVLLKEELENQVIFLLDKFDHIWLVGLLFFGLHLFILGKLIFSSDYFPKTIGVLLQIAAFGYLVDSCAQLLMHNYAEYKELFEMIVIIPGVLGEFSLTIWLLVKGINKPQKHT